MLQCNDKQKKLIKNAALDMKFSTLEPMFNQILIDNMGSNVSPEKFQGWKDFLNLFKDSLKD